MKAVDCYTTALVSCLELQILRRPELDSLAVISLLLFNLTGAWGGPAGRSGPRCPGSRPATHQLMTAWHRPAILESHSLTGRPQLLVIRYLLALMECHLNERTRQGIYFNWLNLNLSPCWLCEPHVCYTNKLSAPSSEHHRPLCLSQYGQPAGKQFYIFSVQPQTSYIVYCPVMLGISLDKYQHNFILEVKTFISKFIDWIYLRYALNSYITS